MEDIGANPFAGIEIPKEYYTWEQFDDDVFALMVKLRRADKKYTGIYAIPRGGLVLGVVLSHALDIPMVMGGVTSNTLVVDEICDTGRSLRPYLGRCDTLTIYKHEDCDVLPTYFMRTNSQWVEFPWEVRPIK